MKTLSAPSGPDLAERQVAAVEAARVDAMLVHTIDSVYKDVERLFRQGDLTAAAFRAYWRRLWTRREAVCDELLAR